MEKVGLATSPREAQKSWGRNGTPHSPRMSKTDGEKGIDLMKHIFCALFVLLFLAGGLTAQERNYESKMTGTMFRGKVLIFESKKNPDGTYTDNYRDNEGNPLSEMERHFVDGHHKLMRTNTFEEFGISIASERDAPASALLHAFGENPDFREFTGITLEQIRNVSLAQWDMFRDFPPDELLNICVRAGQTDDPEELERISVERELYMAEAFGKIDQSVAAILLPEQIQKLWEVEWAMRPAVDFDPDSNVNNSNPINFVMYKALALDTEQQKRLDALKTEYVQARLELFKSSLTGKRKFAKEKELAETMRSKLSDMLTETQRTKMEQFRANKPKFLTAQAPTSPKKAEDYEWTKSWKPGDPIPEGMLPPPPPVSRFPRLL